MNYPHAIVLVSHDRFFLDQVVNRITDIDRRRLVDYTGNYSQLPRHEARRTLAELRAKASRQQEEIERMKRFIDKFRYEGDQGQAGPEPHQDAREDGEDRGAAGAEAHEAAAAGGRAVRPGRPRARTNVRKSPTATTTSSGAASC